MNADETFDHLATECPETRRTRREFFGDTDILHNIDWDVQDVLDFSYSDQINPLLDPNNVHDIHLTDTESEAEEPSD